MARTYIPFPQAFRKPRYRVSKTGEIEELKGIDTFYGTLGTNISQPKMEV